MIQRGASVMLVTLLACGSDDSAAEHADATDVKATDSGSGLDTGWMPVTTYDPEACLEQLPPTAGDEMAVSDEARLVVWGADRDDTTGTSVACGSMDVGGLGPALVIGSPESSDLDEGPGGWLSVFDGTAQGETDITAGDLVVRGAAQTRDRLGTFISLPGDVDADGRGDIVSGGPSSTRHLNIAGVAWLFLDAGATPEESVVATFFGEINSTSMRNAVMADVNVDGSLDMIVAHTNPQADDRPGKLAIHPGPIEPVEQLISQAHTVYVDESLVNYTGRGLAIADVDADGWPDLVHGEPEHIGFNQPGRLIVHLGPLLDDTGEMPLTPDILIHSEQASDGIIGNFLQVGDLNGDGALDLVFADVSASHDTENRAGAVYAFFGPLTAGTSVTADRADLIFRGNVAWGLFGNFAIADHDGDGWVDLMVTEPNGAGAPFCPGRVYVFHGPFEPGRLDPYVDAEVVYREDIPRSGLGVAIDACDLDGDGRAEIVLGMPNVPRNGLPGVGRVQVLPGRAR